MKEILKAQKQAKARQAVGNTCLAEQQPLAATKERRRIMTLEEGAAHSEGLLGCCEVMQGEN